MCGPLMLPLVGLLSDPVERCRSSAFNTLANAVAVIPDVAPLLMVLVPALAARMGSLPVQEPSEELRLAVAELLRALVGKVPGRCGMVAAGASSGSGRRMTRRGHLLAEAARRSHGGVGLSQAHAMYSWNTE